MYIKKFRRANGGSFIPNPPLATPLQTKHAMMRNMTTRMPMMMVIMTMVMIITSPLFSLLLFPRISPALCPTCTYFLELKLTEIASVWLYVIRSAIYNTIHFYKTLRREQRPSSKWNIYMFTQAETWCRGWEGGGKIFAEPNF